MKKLGEICCKKQQIVRAVKKYSPTDNIVYIDISAIDSSTNEIKEPTTMLLKDAPSRAQQVVEKNDILVSLVRPNLKNIALICDDKNNLVASSGFCVLRTKENPRFLKYIVLGEPFTNYLISRTSGANYPAVREDDVKGYSIPLPPLPEQEKIVAELDCLSGIIEKKKQQLKELDALAQSIFYEMFGDPVENEKGWEVKKLGEVCNIICGQDYKLVKDDNGKYPIYGTGGIMGYASQYRCPANSIIIGRKGNINNPLFVDCDFWNVDTAFGVVPNAIYLEPQYFFFFCKNYDFTIHDVSVTIPSLRRTDILKIDIPLPPLSLQHSFASKIEAIEKQKTLIKQSIAETETLFNSRMQEYF